MTATLSEIYRPIQSQLQASEQLLLTELGAGQHARRGLLIEMTRHVAQMSGKRIRPALALLGAALAHEGAKGRNGANGARAWAHRAVKLATAVEMIHTATLLHDDVIDGASLRRGISTLNAKWGDTLSVLSGDFLYSKAFCLLSELDHPAVLRLMSDTARIVCEGEVAQIQHQYDLTLMRSEYLKIIDWKTASLMGGSAQAGALLGGATPARAARLGTFGRCFGLAFQILDDTQDLVGDEEALGKSLGTDLALGQLTLPLLYLRDSADPDLRSQLAQWFNGNGSRSAGQAREQLEKIKEEAIRLRVPAYCRRVAGRYLLQAKQALAPFPESPHKDSLLVLTDFLAR
ncbi:MAG: polyprenyl synthetase family protein [Candidatus Omnitrophica bacterium]|nr:polyprenyl synthetase family protein [Candidatus Omnitrophota bacterium]